MKQTRAIPFLLLALAACGSPPGGDDAGALDGSRADAGPRVEQTCADDPCPEGEECREVSGGFECECPAGAMRTDEGCEAIAVCDDRTCDGHGTCEESEDGPVCTCEDAYAGAHCEECDTGAGYVRHADGTCTLTPCAPNPCTDDGRTRCVVADGAASCGCDAGTHDEGGDCVPDTVCTPTTCNERGACEVGPSGVLCDCVDGWAGAFCDGCDDAAGYHPDGAGGCTMDLCLPNPCTAALESVCTSDAGGVTCSCDVGAHRDGGLCVPDEVCEAETCAPTGACSVVDGVTTCACDAGYAGARCADCDAGFHPDGAGGCTDDVCVPSPCTAPMRGVCVDDGGSARCDCDAGLHEDGVGGCTADPCVPDPCAASNQACRATGADTYECFTPACDDGNPCTDDVLVGGACTYPTRAAGSACSTTVCVTGQTCTGTTCGGGAAVSCDDGDPCTADSCDPVTGCAWVVDEALVPDDGVACTTDSCVGGESHVPTDGRCDDGLFCNGAEACAPTDGAADAEGCVSGAAPTRPWSTPCRQYGACDESIDGFPLTSLGVGESCDDTIACTSGDVCDARGLCAGTPLSSCPSSGACNSTTAFGGAVDIAVAELSGAITVGGAALPAELPSNHGGGFNVLLRSWDTDQRHYIGHVQYTDFSRYLTAGTDTVAARVVPGVYDVIYDRAHSEGSASSWPSVARTNPASTFPNGYVVLQAGVVLSPGAQTLDVDVPFAEISGSITVGGAALPAEMPGNHGGGFSVLLRSATTGQRHYIGHVQYTDFSRYLTVGSDTVSGRVVPGTYDLIYDRGHSEGSASSWPSVARTNAASVFPNGYVVLQEDLVIGAGAQTLDVDVPVAELSGAITFGGAALPAELPSNHGGGFNVLAISRTTQQRHYIAHVQYTDFSRYLTAGSDTVSGRLVPGTYDIVYDRGHSEGSASSWPSVARTNPASVFPNGYVMLQEGVVLTAGAQTLDLDIPYAELSGAITVGGAPLPAEMPSNHGGGFSLLLQDQTTGQRHYVAHVQYTDFSRYLTAGTDTVSGRLVPGTYDLIYDRGHSEGSASSWPSVARTSAASAFPNGYVVLQEGIVLGAGSQTLDVDVPVAELSGAITALGAALPAEMPSNHGGGFNVLLVSRASEQRHYIGHVQYTDFSRYLTAGTDTVSGRVVPGVYDLVYDRGHSEGSDSSWSSAARTNPASVFPNGYVVLQAGLTIGAGAQTLDVDVPAVTLGGPVTVLGEAPPAAMPSNHGGGFSLLFVPRAAAPGAGPEGPQRQYVSHVQYTDFSRYLTAGTDSLGGALVPGVYDVLFDRGHSEGSLSSWPSVARTNAASLFPNGYARVSSCVLVQ